MTPFEYVNLTFEALGMTSFAYPDEEDNFWIASKSYGSSQIMVNGEFSAQKILTLTLQAKDLGVGNNPSYLRVRSPEPFQIPITVVAEL